MPDEPRDGDTPEPKEDDLDVELSEFEAGLSKAIGPIPSRAMPDLSRFPEPEEMPTPELPSDEEIEERLSRAIKEAERHLGPIRADDVGKELELLDELEQSSPTQKGRLDHVHAEFEDELGALRKKSTAARVTHAKSQMKEESRIANDRDSHRGLAIGLSAAFGFIGPMFAGYLVGWLIDRSNRQEGVWSTWLTVIGMGAGFVYLVTVLNRLSDNRGPKR